MEDELSLRTSELAPNSRLLSPHPPRLPQQPHNSFQGSNNYSRRSIKSAIPWSQVKQHSNIIYKMGAFNYARHNPHPRLVRHVKGLLDLPMCYVETFDSGNMQPQVVPPFMNSNGIKSYSIPNINSQNLPLNTLNGLPLLSSVKGEELWKKELASLTEAVLLPSLSKIELEDTRQSHDQLECHPYPICRPRTPSILTHREKPHWAKTSGALLTDTAEMRVFHLLSQLLEASDQSSVQTWLCTASDDEKWHALQQLTTAFQNTFPSPGDKQDVLYKTRTQLLTENLLLTRASTSLCEIIECDENQKEGQSRDNNNNNNSNNSNQEIKKNGQGSSFQIDSSNTDVMNQNEMTSLLPRPYSMSSDRNAIRPLTGTTTSGRPLTTSRPRTSLSRQITPALSLDGISDKSKMRSKTMSNQSIQVNLTNSTNEGNSTSNPLIRYVNASNCLRNQNLVRTTRNFHPNFIHVRSSVA